MFCKRCWKTRDGELGSLMLWVHGSYRTKVTKNVWLKEVEKQADTEISILIKRGTWKERHRYDENGEKMERGGENHPVVRTRLWCCLLWSPHARTRMEPHGQVGLRLSTC